MQDRQRCVQAARSVGECEVLVQDVLDRKGSHIYQIGPDASVGKAVGMLAAWDVGVVLVTDPHAHLLGIISERDLVRALSQLGGSFLRMRASELMTRQVVTCEPENTIGDSLALMGLHRIRHLPVVQHGKIRGVISIRDLIRCRFDLHGPEAPDDAAPGNGTAEAARAIAAARRAHRSKSEVIANISYELRTPLTTVIGFSEIIAQGLLGPNAEALYRQYAGDINAAGLHLLKRVDELLELAQESAEQFALQEREADTGDAPGSLSDRLSLSG